MTTEPTPEQLADIAEALKSGAAIVCYAECWGCNFGQHDSNPHTWMDDEDLSHAGIPLPETAEGWAALAADKPCGCDCNKANRTAQTREAS